jgi:hypothetical protein
VLNDKIKEKKYILKKIAKKHNLVEMGRYFFFQIILIFELE